MSGTQIHRAAETHATEETTLRHILRQGVALIQRLSYVIVKGEREPFWGCRLYMVNKAGLPHG